MQTALGIRPATPPRPRSHWIPGHQRRVSDYRHCAAVTATADRRESWVTKQKLAIHLSVTPRWIVQQQALGLPHMHMGGINRYVVSEVEGWLRERYGEPKQEAA
jgi:hypothetical protein